MRLAWKRPRLHLFIFKIPDRIKRAYARENNFRKTLEVFCMEEGKKNKAITRRAFIGGTVGVAGALGAMSVLGGCATAGAAAAGWPPHRADSPIFQPTRIGSLELKNKMIRAAMAEFRFTGELGSPTPALIQMWGDDAAGGVGMVMTGGISVLKDDIPETFFGGFSDPSQIPLYREAADTVHRNGAKLCAQIMMVGERPHLMVDTISREDIQRAVNGFAQTTVMLRDAGFDAINFHFAHGFLLANFWSGSLNTRTDEYGGSAENRARFAFEVVEATRRAVGRDFPITAKINGNEHTIRPGSSQEETNFYVQGLADRGVDAVEVSGAGGAARLDILSKEDQNYFSRDARMIARSVNVPLMLTGGIRNVMLMEEALRHNNNIVAFGMARTILAEPELPNIWQGNTNYNPRCIACNFCLAELVAHRRVVCVLDQNRA